MTKTLISALLYFFLFAQLPIFGYLYEGFDFDEKKEQSLELKKQMQAYPVMGGLVHGTLVQVNH